jgi:PAS domain S-box-containing protein
MKSIDAPQEYVLTDQDIIVTKTNLKGIITYVNDDLLRITGYSEKELIGASHNIFRHADMPKEAFADLWRTILSEYTWRGVVKNRTKNGGYYWVHADVTPVYEDKSIVGFMSVRIKPTIAEVHRAEIAYTRMKAGVFAGKLLYGSIIEDNVADRIHRRIEDIPITTKFSLMVGLGVAAIGVLATLDHLAINRLSESHQVTLSQVQSYVHELNTQHNEQVAVLEQQIEQYAHEGNAVTRKSKDTAIINERFFQIKSHSSQTLADVQNRNIFIVFGLLVVVVLLYEGIIRSIIKPLKEAQDGLRELSNGVYRFPAHYRSKNELGRMMEALRTASVRLGFDVANEKKISAEIIKMYEANNLLQAQVNQLQRIESIGRMTAGLSHNFNNILGAIIGYNQMNLFVADDCDNEDLKQELIENTKQIQLSSERAVTLVKHMMSYTGQNAVRTLAADISPTIAVIDEVLSMVRPALTSVFQVRANLDPNIDIHIDSNYLHQIVTNLIMNARDAMNGIGGQIDVKLSTVYIEHATCTACLQPLSGHFIELRVTDAGTGIPQDIIPHIFDPFFTTKPVGEGTGLGLSTVSGMVHESDGHMMVESKTDLPNNGTVFRLLFPIK